MNVSHIDLDVVHDALYQLLHEPFLQSTSVRPVEKVETETTRELNAGPFLTNQTTNSMLETATEC